MLGSWGQPLCLFRLATLWPWETYLQSKKKQYKTSHDSKSKIHSPQPSLRLHPLRWNPWSGQCQWKASARTWVNDQLMYILSLRWFDVFWPQYTSIIMTLWQQNPYELWKYIDNTSSDRNFRSKYLLRGKLFLKSFTDFTVFSWLPVLFMFFSLLSRGAWHCTSAPLAATRRYTRRGPHCRNRPAGGPWRAHSPGWHCWRPSRPRTRQKPSLVTREMIVEWDGLMWYILINDGEKWWIHPKKVGINRNGACFTL